jgi:hypothetical protein
LLLIVFFLLFSKLILLLLKTKIIRRTREKLLWHKLLILLYHKSPFLLKQLPCQVNKLGCNLEELNVLLCEWLHRTDLATVLFIRKILYTLLHVILKLVQHFWGSFAYKLSDKSAQWSTTLKAFTNYCHDLCYAAPD